MTDTLSTALATDHPEHDRYLPWLDNMLDGMSHTEAFYNIDVKGLPIASKVKRLTPPELLSFLQASLFYDSQLDALVSSSTNYQREAFSYLLFSLIRPIFRKKLPYSQPWLASTLAVLVDSTRLDSGYIEPLLKKVEVCLLEDEVSGALSQVLRQVSGRFEARAKDQHDHKDFVIAELAQRLATPPDVYALPLFDEDPWSQTATNSIKAMPQTKQNAWRVLLLECAQNKASKPTAKWLKHAKSLLLELGWQHFKTHMLEWLALLTHSRQHDLLAVDSSVYHPQALDARNNDTLKALIWLLSLEDDQEVARCLRNTGVVCFNKIPNVGPKSTKIGNATIAALTAMPNGSGLAQLAAMKVKITYRQALSVLDRALEQSAKAQGIPMHALAEMGIPHCGLTKVGFGDIAFGDHTAQINVLSSNKIDVRWHMPSGKRQKSIPALIKSAFPDELKDFKVNLKEIKQLLSIHKTRLEKLCIEEPCWDYDTWQERYLQHPLMGVLSQTLVWQLSRSNHQHLVLFRNGQFEDVEGHICSDDFSSYQVSLWHPIHSTKEVVHAWRQRLVALEITQAFKQAYREIYRLTDAEKETHVYSNRFAAHIIEQHKFSALAKSRNWIYSLKGPWDSQDGDLASLDLPEHSLTVQFWIKPIHDPDTDSCDTPVYSHLSTDQVRFFVKDDTHSPIALADIPEVVFSEVMRDVDLFIGVSSIGNDPEWQDGGLNGHLQSYWHKYSFGNLSQIAETRKALLETIVPRLNIADRCHFTDKYLIVDGRLRSYKIHLGSSNILMSPNDQYLCIVPDSAPKPPNTPALPFEGDLTLSIILSKAVLLANDNDITDDSILRQIVDQ